MTTTLTTNEIPVVKTDDIKAVADAIRERDGREEVLTQALVFPDGFVSAIQNIPGDSLEIHNCSYLYYDGARFHIFDKYIKNVTKAAFMFRQCGINSDNPFNPEHFNYPDWGLNCDDYSSMFANNSGLVADLSQIALGGSLQNIFQYCGRLTVSNLHSGNKPITSMYGFLSNITVNNEILDLSGLTNFTTNTLNLLYAFASTKYNTIIFPDFSNTACNCGNMFMNVKKTDAFYLKFGRITNANYMFASSNFSEIDLKDSPIQGNAAYMFNGCSNLITAKICIDSYSGLDVENTRMNMFSSCGSLTDIWIYGNPDTDIPLGYLKYADSMFINTDKSKITLHIQGDLSTYQNEWGTKGFADIVAIEE